MCRRAPPLSCNAANRRLSSASPRRPQTYVGTAWLIMCSFIVFFMQARSLPGPPQTLPVTAPPQPRLSSLSPAAPSPTPAQAGFAALESGAIRAKNTKSLLLKTLLDQCVLVLQRPVFLFVGTPCPFRALLPPRPS